MKKLALQRLKFYLVLLSLVSTIASAWAQGLTVKGKVTDDKDVPLGGVSVLSKGSKTGTSTDVNGNFSLNVSNANGSIIVSFVGFANQEIPINKRTTIDISLTPDVASLGEAVVIGYGSQVKKVVTGAVQTINLKDVRDIPVSQVTQKLQGKLAGVQINQTTGKPGQGMSVRIRGQLSVSAGSDPLYVVDGNPITGSIGAINPDEIENISILKDAASTSLYGSRAANGVVLITTKRGKKGQTAVSFNTFAGVQQVPVRGRVKMMDAEEFAQFKNEYYTDAGQPVPIEFQNPSQYAGKNNDWYGALLRKAPLQSYNLTVTSNTDKISSSF